MSLSTALDDVSVTCLKGAGIQTVKRLKKLGIDSVQDLLFHVPLRYEDRTKVHSIGQLAPGQNALVEGRIQSTQITGRSRSSLILRIADDTGSLVLRFFHFTSRQSAMLEPGAWLRCYGEIRSGYYDLEIVHPEYQHITDSERGIVEASYTPVYPLTQGLNQGTLRRLAEQAVGRLHNAGPESSGLNDWIPEAILKSLGLPNFRDALIALHAPCSAIEIQELQQNRHPAQRRLAFEELLAHHLNRSQARHAIRSQTAARFVRQGKAVSRFLEALPFPLTDAQIRVIAEVEQDLTSGEPMMRLLQGDVGSGKTVVAAAAALLSIGSRHQAAMMVPTELLAEQHYAVFLEWFEPLGIQVVLLTGKHRGSEREEILGGILNGRVGMVIGTHALFQEDVRFSNLGLVVIDEQHRFGVYQRLAFRQKAGSTTVCPHQLVMSATPIPRTLAMLRFADLDISILDESPPGRVPVTTSVIGAHRRNEVIERIKGWIQQGRQVYWVCTLIEESEMLQAEAAENTWDVLKKSLPDIAIGLIHGRMKSEEKEEIMSAFTSRRLDLLVATTVIEVGVDVPNAGLMVIENAERLGLSQLHQLRGRVGRGSERSYCVLMYRPPLSQSAQQRLSILRETTDGFRIAEQDLKMRGPGDVLGTRQTGQLQLRIADLVRDRDLIGKVREAADVILRDYSDNVQPLIRRWLKDSGRFAEV